MFNKEVLNPKLYAALQTAASSTISVVNPGQRGTTVINYANGKPYAAIQGGQQFKLDCPVCNDTRGRLFVSYLVGMPLIDKEEPVRTYHLMYCHNEQCNNIDLYKSVKRIMRADDRDDESITISSKPARDSESMLCLPKGSVLINSTKAHPAPVAYMKNRGFDIDELAKTYGVLATPYVERAPYLGACAVFPYYEGNKLAFWQARTSYEIPNDMRLSKYYNPPDTYKSNIVYNKLNALQCPIVVVTEGVMDALTMKKAGVCIFGKVPSNVQMRILTRLYANKVVVFALDPDAWDKTSKLVADLKTSQVFNKGVFALRFPDGTDPSSLGEAVTWDYILKAIQGGN
jgi:hypothetical protein